MKNLIIASALAVTALTGAASAMTSATDANLAAIRSYAPQADLTDLTTAEVNTLLSIVHGGDSESEKRNAVRAIVN